MNALVTLATCVGGLLAIMAVWIAVQSIVRKRSGCGNDKDVLEHMAHGCAGCKGDGACHNRANAAHETVEQGR